MFLRMKITVSLCETDTVMSTITIGLQPITNFGKNVVQISLKLVVIPYSKLSVENI